MLKSTQLNIPLEFIKKYFRINVSVRIAVIQILFVIAEIYFVENITFEGVDSKVIFSTKYISVPINNIWIIVILYPDVGTKIFFDKF